MLTFVFQHQTVLWNVSRGHKIVLKHSRGWWWQYIKDGKVHIVAHNSRILTQQYIKNAWYTYWRRSSILKMTWYTQQQCSGGLVAWHGTLSRPRASAPDAMVRFQSCSHHWVFYNTNTYTTKHTHPLEMDILTHTHTHKQFKTCSRHWLFLTTHCSALLPTDVLNITENCSPRTHS